MTTTRLYYGAPRPRGIDAPDLTGEPLSPDGEFYCDDKGQPLAVLGIRLTKEPTAWCRTWLLIAIDVPLEDAALASYRVAWDWKHESYDLPVDLANASRRVWVRDEQVMTNLMLAYGEDEMGESVHE